MSSRIPIKLAMCALAIGLLTVVAQAQEGSQRKSSIGYPTVEAALAALKAREGVKVSLQQGWTIIEDQSNNKFVLWSFAPSNHPAHPTAIRREIVKDSAGISVEMSALCQAAKAACDRLIGEFKELNNKMRDSMQRDLQQSLVPERLEGDTKSDIQIQKLGDGWYRLVLKSFRSSSVDAGQQELLPTAKETCPEKSVRYGKYEFETSEPVSPTVEKRPLLLKQEIHCVDTVDDPGIPSPAATAPAPPQWNPSPEQERLIERLTYAYFSAKDTLNYREAYSLLSATQQATMPFERWRSMIETFNSKAGNIRSRRIKKITWYKDPPQAPSPGVYAAADFVSEFTNIEIHCGYVVWHQQQDGLFRLVREEENFIDKEMQQKLPQNELVAARARFGC